MYVDGTEVNLFTDVDAANNSNCNLSHLMKIDNSCTLLFEDKMCTRDVRKNELTDEPKNKPKQAPTLPRTKNSRIELFSVQKSIGWDAPSKSEFPGF